MIPASATSLDELFLITLYPRIEWRRVSFFELEYKWNRAFYLFRNFSLSLSRDILYSAANKLSDETATLDSDLQLSLVMKIDSPANRVSHQLQLQATLPAASCRLNVDRLLLAARCESRTIAYPLRFLSLVFMTRRR